MTTDEIKKLKNAYYTQKSATTRRVDASGNPIEFRLTFEEWLQIWLESGHLHERGNKKGQYCMSRKDDLGHYEVGNVFIQLTSQNSQEAIVRKENKDKRLAALKIAMSRPEVKAKMARKMARSIAKPCTVDGITIYPSRTALIAELGEGKSGTRNPNFRYVLT